MTKVIVMMICLQKDQRHLTLELKKPSINLNKKMKTLI